MGFVGFSAEEAIGVVYTPSRTYGDVRTRQEFYEAFAGKKDEVKP